MTEKSPEDVNTETIIRLGFLTTFDSGKYIRDIAALAQGALPSAFSYQIPPNHEELLITLREELRAAEFYAMRISDLYNIARQLSEEPGHEEMLTDEEID